MAKNPGSWVTETGLDSAKGLTTDDGGVEVPDRIESGARSSVVGAVPEPKTLAGSNIGEEGTELVAKRGVGGGCGVG